MQTDHMDEDLRTTQPTLGVFGYVLAVGISLLVLGAEWGFIAFASGDVAGALPFACLVVLFGLVPAAILGPPGALVVHLVTRRLQSQWWSVAVAGVVGYCAGYLEFRMAGWGVMLAVATATGRMAVIPYARRSGRLSGRARANAA